MRIVCASLSGAGHAHPMAAVARALVARGHDVTFCSGAAHAEDAARAGASFLELPISRGSPRDALEPYEDAEDMARMLAPEFAARGFDVGVVDLLTLGPALALEMCGVRYATLSIHPLHMFSRHLPPFGWGSAPGRGIFAVRDAWMRRGAVRDLVCARESLNRARERLGLTLVDRLDAQVSDELILVATLPSLEVPRADWPGRAHVIGPCLWDGGDEAQAIPAGDGPLVLVAATTAHDESRMARAATEAARAIGARVLSTDGFISHDAVLPLCDAVVTSGGHGIVARSLSHGVPLLVVPGHGDQRENGYRVERAGAGLRVMRPRARAIARSLRRLLEEPGFAERAREIQREAAALNGPARAAELVERLHRSLTQAEN